jgi:hypothetical protein
LGTGHVNRGVKDFNRNAIVNWYFTDQSTNSGFTKVKAYFSDQSINTGTVNGDAYLSGHSSNTGVITGNTLQYITEQDAAKGAKRCCCGCPELVGTSFHKCVVCGGAVFGGICFIDGGENGVNGTCLKCAGKKR